MAVVTVTDVAELAGVSSEAAPQDSRLARCLDAAKLELAKYYVIDNDDPDAAMFEATCLRAAQLYRRNQSITGVAQASEFGPVFVRASDDPDIARLLERKWSFR